MQCMFCDGEIRVDVCRGQVDAFCTSCEKWQGGDWADTLTGLLATVPGAYLDLRNYVELVRKDQDGR